MTCIYIPQCSSSVVHCSTDGRASTSQYDVNASTSAKLQAPAFAVLLANQYLLHSGMLPPRISSARKQLRDPIRYRKEQFLHWSRLKASTSWAWGRYGRTFKQTPHLSFPLEYFCLYQPSTDYQRLYLYRDYFFNHLVYFIYSPLSCIVVIWPTVIFIYLLRTPAIREV